MEHLFTSPEFWVAAAFVGFVALMIYLKVPGAIGRALDKRSAQIEQQLEEARRLREEAQGLLANWQRRQRQAKEEAAEIVRHAEATAKRTAEDTRKQLEEAVQRREAQTAEKIEQAKARAVQEVTSVAVDVATEVARRLIAEEMDKKTADRLFDESVASIGKTLH